jgi:hypothetical protein
MQKALKTLEVSVDLEVVAGSSWQNPMDTPYSMSARMVLDYSISYNKRSLNPNPYLVTRIDLNCLIIQKCGFYVVIDSGNHYL